jgi:uncharacterized protein (DUF58 family)
MSGQYRSNFKGHGVQFSEHRVYVPGDDVRHIDWKVSARSKEPLIRKYEEERELTVFLVVDISGSQGFGSAKELKSQAAAQIAGMLAYAAIHTGDRVGMLLFAGKVEKIIPPKKGKLHILRIIREILAFEPTTKTTDLPGALQAAGRIMKHSGIVFVVSDFILNESRADGDLDLALKRLARRHDVVALKIGDERELAMPEVGHVIFADPETGEEHVVDTAAYGFQKWLEQRRRFAAGQFKQRFRSSGAQLLEVTTQEDYLQAVVRFFRSRARRRR